MTTEIATFSAPRLPYHPAVEERFGVDKGQWKVLTDAIFPSAKTADAIVLALSYCKVRNLDPFKRPLHIVPIYDSARGEYIESVWPSISELRTTASRTGQYAGCDEAEFGDEKTVVFKGRVKKWVDKKQVWVDDEKSVTFPEWCRITVYRIVGGQRCKFVGPKVKWIESYATIGNSDIPNDMWESRTEGQLEKCAEAAALRRAFPEELGNELTAEEMHGRKLNDLPVEVAEAIASEPRDSAPPRGTSALSAPKQETAKAEPEKAKPEPEQKPKPEPEPETENPAPAGEQVEDGVFEEESDSAEDGGDFGSVVEAPKFEEPVALETKGHTFLTLGNLFIAKVQQTTAPGQVFDWASKNHKALDQIAQGAPKVSSQIKLAQEEQLKKLRAAASAAQNVAKAEADKAPPRQAKKSTKATKDAPKGDDDPEAVLRRIDAALSRVEKGDDLDTVWNDDCLPLMEDLMPPDKDAAQGMLRHHEKRLGA